MAATACVSACMSCRPCRHSPNASCLCSCYHTGAQASYALQLSLDMQMHSHILRGTHQAIR